MSIVTTLNAFFHAIVLVGVFVAVLETVLEVIGKVFWLNPIVVVDVLEGWIVV